MQTGFYLDKTSGLNIAANLGNIVKKADVYEVKAFRMVHFKAFRDTGWIEVNHLTLLFGQNSSGKSALYQVLQMLLYAYNCMMREEYFSDLSYMEKITGNFQDLCNKRIDDPVVKIGFLLQNQESKTEYWVQIAQKQPENTGYVENVYGKRKDESCDFLKYYHSINMFFLERREDIHIPVEIESMAEEMLLSIRSFARSLQMIAAHRHQPDRVMELTGIAPRSIGNAGETTFPMLYALSEMQGKQTAMLRGWLEKFGYTYRWQMVGINRGVFLLKDLKTGIESNLVDNGFGISQSLPLAVALDMIDGKTLLVDSPEAFLQTKMQSEMGDLMIEGSKNGRILLETGSEYLFLRIRRRVAEGVFLKENLSVYYLEETGYGETICHKLTLDEFGEFQDPPDSFVQFFSSDYEDIERMDEIRRKKRCSRG